MWKFLLTVLAVIACSPAKKFQPTSPKASHLTLQKYCDNRLLFAIGNKPQGMSIGFTLDDHRYRALPGSCVKNSESDECDKDNELVKLFAAAKPYLNSLLGRSRSEITRQQDRLSESLKRAAQNHFGHNYQNIEAFKKTVSLIHTRNYIAIEMALAIYHNIGNCREIASSTAYSIVTLEKEPIMSLQIISVQQNSTIHKFVVVGGTLPETYYPMHGKNAAMYMQDYRQYVDSQLQYEEGYVIDPWSGYCGLLKNPKREYSLMYRLPGNYDIIKVENIPTTDSLQQHVESYQQNEQNKQKIKTFIEKYDFITNFKALRRFLGLPNLPDLPSLVRAFYQTDNRKKPSSLGNRAYHKNPDLNPEKREL